MSSRTWLFGSNWKMNKTVPEAVEYARLLEKRLKGMQLDGAQVFVIPPFTALGPVLRISRGSFLVGAQNMHWESAGPYTGEISPLMLRDLGVDLVEIGHAERRQYFNETDLDVNRKVISAIQSGLRPLICVGELLADKHYGVELETVSRQLRIAVHGVIDQQASRLIVAYEPVWAIGDSGTTADNSHIQKMISALRDVLRSAFSASVAESIPLLYGGSVFPEDAPSLLLSTGVDGLFVGRAAIEAEAFADLISDCLTEISSRGPGTTRV